MTLCSMALGQYTAREDNCPEEYTAAGEYVSDCQACHNYPDFVFTYDTGWTDGEQTRCLNFFVGVMEACWTAHRAAAGAPCFEACDDDFVTLQGTTHGLCAANLDCEWKERYDADTDSWSTGCGKRDPCPDEQAAAMAEVMAGCADPSNVTCVRALDLPSLSSWQALGSCDAGCNDRPCGSDAGIIASDVLMPCLDDASCSEIWNTLAANSALGLPVDTGLCSANALCCQIGECAYEGLPQVAETISCSPAARAEENPAPPPPCDDSVAGIVIYCSEFYQAVQSQDVTFVAMTSMPASEWTDTIWNYTTYMTADARSQMAGCEMSLTDHTMREDNCPEEITAAGEYASDCQACNGILSPFSFNYDTGMPDGDQTRCLNFFVGVMEACWEEPENAIVAQLTLAMDMPSSPGELRAFKSSFATDVAATLDGVSATDVILTGVAPGSVVVDFYIKPAADGTALIGAAAVAMALGPGVMIAGTTLTSESITAAPVSAGTPAYLASPVTEAPTSATSLPASSSEEEEGSSIVVVVVVVVVLIVLGSGVAFALQNPAVRQRLNLGGGSASTNSELPASASGPKPDGPVPPSRPEVSSRPTFEATESPLGAESLEI